MLYLSLLREHSYFTILGPIIFGILELNVFAIHVFDSELSLSQILYGWGMFGSIKRRYDRRLSNNFFYFLGCAA